MVIVTSLPVPSVAWQRVGRDCSTTIAHPKGNREQKSSSSTRWPRASRGNKKAAQHALESVIDTITREVAKGNKVAITGFGSFEKRSARPGWSATRGPVRR